MVMRSFIIDSIVLALCVLVASCKEKTTTIVLEADVFTEEKKLMAHSIATMFVSGTDERFPRHWDEDGGGADLGPRKMP